MLASKSVSLVEIAGVKENKPRTHGKVEQCPEIASAFRYLGRTVKKIIEIFEKWRSN